MAEFARTTCSDAARAALNAFSLTSPPGSVLVAIERTDTGPVTTADTVERALREAATTYTPKMDLSRVEVAYVGSDERESRFVLSRIRKVQTW